MAGDDSVGRIITAEEYASWVPAQLTLTTLFAVRRDIDAWRRTLFRHLNAGTLRAAARRMMYDRDGEVVQREYWLISRREWSRATTRDLFTTNEMDIDLYEGDERYRELELEPENKISLTGIRFERSYLIEINPVFSDASEEIADGSPAMRRKQDLPVLHASIAEAWMAWFKTQPNPTKQRAEESAAHMFPNHNLSRDRIRDLFGYAALGRPQKSKS